MTDTTQPPAETLDTVREAFERYAQRERGSPYREGDCDCGLKDARASVAALTRRAGGDAIPADATYTVDDRGLFCRHCGKASWRHYRVTGVGNFCTPKPPADGDAEVGLFVVENTDGKFVASFSTQMLANFFVDEGGGCYRHRGSVKPSIGGDHG